MTETEHREDACLCKANGCELFLVPALSNVSELEPPLHTYKNRRDSSRVTRHSQAQIHHVMRQPTRFDI